MCIRDSSESSESDQEPELVRKHPNGRFLPRKKQHESSNLRKAEFLENVRIEDPDLDFSEGTGEDTQASSIKPCSFG